MSSKKMLRLIIIMAVLLVMAIGVYLLVDRSKQKQEEAELAEQASLQLFSFDPDNVGLVTFDSEEGHFGIEFVSNAWTLTETDYPYDLDLNTYYVSMVCSNMAILTATQKIAADTDHLDMYGLTEPAVVTCYEGSTEHTLYIGGPSATEELYYVMLPGDDTVYGISYETGKLLRGGTFYLRNHYLIPYHESEITGYSLVRNNAPSLVLDKKDGIWHMAEPIPDGNINSATVNSMLTNVTRVEFDTVITDVPGTDLTAYGLNKPDYTLTVDTDEGAFVIRFAFDPENETNLYVLHENTGLISAVTVNAAGFLNARPDELMSSTLLSISFEDTAELDVMVDYHKYFTMTMDHENGQYLLNEHDVAPLGSNAVSTYKNIFDTMAKMSYESVDLDADIPEDAKAAHGFAFTMTDGSKTVLTLIESDEENLYWALIDGKYTGLTVRRRALTGNTGVWDFYERMMDIIDNQ